MKMMRTMRFRQRGVTAIGWMIILGLIAFFTLLTIRVAPMYLEYSTVDSVLETVKEEAETNRMSVSDIRKTIVSRFDINDVKNVKDEHLKTEVKGSRLYVTVHYEVKQPMIKQINLLGIFDKTVEINMPAR